MSRPIITLTTDFGHSDSYVAQMKGAMLAVNPEALLLDVTHQVPPQDVLRASLILAETVAAFPTGTIHVVVVDPGVGTERPMVAAKMAEQRFIAPDNGVLSRVAERWPPAEVVELTERQFWRESISATFHGRDIMGPAAAHWSRGIAVGELGSPLQRRLFYRPFPQPEQRNDCIEGEILWPDRFGNLITNISAELLPEPHRQQSVVQFGSQRLALQTSYAERSPGELLALFGSSGWLEIAVSQGSAAEKLAWQRGDAVRVIQVEANDE